MEQVEELKRPWYKEPFVWMVIFFPTMAVIGGMITIRFAIVSNDGVLVDDYYKQGLEINRSFERDKAATAYGLIADVKFNPSQKVVHLHLYANDNFQYPDNIVATFQHHTRQGFDTEITFKRIANDTYTADFPELVAGRWYLQLADKDWRLTNSVKMPLERSREYRLTPTIRAS